MKSFASQFFNKLQDGNCNSSRRINVSFNFRNSHFRCLRRLAHHISHCRCISWQYLGLQCLYCTFLYDLIVIVNFVEQIIHCVSSIFLKFSFGSLELSPRIRSYVGVAEEATCDNKRHCFILHSFNQSIYLMLQFKCWINMIYM
jgi:hypothetical protein